MSAGVLDSWVGVYLIFSGKFGGGRRRARVLVVSDFYLFLVDAF
jgi:hypothetical protein